MFGIDPLTCLLLALIFMGVLLGGYGYIHGYLLAAICTLINAGWIVYLFHDKEPAGVAVSFTFLIFVAVCYLYMWWKGGGGDDFKKKRKKLSAAMKAKLKMAKSFQPKLVPAPSPA